MELLPLSPSVGGGGGGGSGGIRSGTLSLSVGGCVVISSILASLSLRPGSLRPVQVTAFEFIFCRARLSPWRGGVGREEGRRNSFVSTILAPLLLPSLVRLPPSSGGTSPWGQWGPGPLWDLLPWGRTSRSGLGLSPLTLPAFALPQSIRGGRASELKQIHGFVSHVGKLRPRGRTQHTWGLLHLPSAIDETGAGATENRGKLPPIPPSTLRERGSP